MIEKELDGKYGTDACIISYFTSTGKVIFALDNYIKNTNVGLGVVGFGQWGSKTILNHLFTHIFDVMKCKRTSVLIRPDNYKSIKLAKALGFVHECDLRGMNLGQWSLLPQDSKYYVDIK